MTIIKKSAFLLVMLLSIPLWAEGRIIYGEGFAFSVEAPTKWVLDVSNAPPELNLILYPQGQTWADASSVMYARVLKKGKRQIQDIIKEDEADFLQRCPQGKIEKKSLTVKIKNPSETRSFLCSGNAYEAVTFIDIEKVAVLFVLSSRTETAFNAGLKDFENLVRSFGWIASEVKAKH
ncbi:MAG: hypothetical protein HY877_02685 [Deltaproteobacteria bacterium]|nr:hypothetical protein [Deltaproteobacteria bacterium]